jgi:hypothetical protein
MKVWLSRFILILAVFMGSLELLRVHYGPVSGAVFQLVVLVAAAPLLMIACFFAFIRIFKERANLLRAHDAKMKAEMESLLDGHKKK